jgi:hypothetical protein
MFSSSLRKGVWISLCAAKSRPSDRDHGGKGEVAGSKPSRKVVARLPSLTRDVQPHIVITRRTRAHQSGDSQKNDLRGNSPPRTTLAWRVTLCFCHRVDSLSGDRSRNDPKARSRSPR